MRELVARRTAALEVDGATRLAAVDGALRRIALARRDDDDVARRRALDLDADGAVLAPQLRVDADWARAPRAGDRAIERWRPARRCPPILGCRSTSASSNVGVDQLDWRVGERGGRSRGLEFGYSGGAREHSGRRRALGHRRAGTSAGEATLAAARHLPLARRIEITGDARARGIARRYHGSGARCRAHRRQRARERTRKARVHARARTLTPFAATPLTRSHVDASDVDLAAFEPALPSTELTVTLRARPAPDGFAGTHRATNADAGAHRRRGACRLRPSLRSFAEWRDACAATTSMRASPATQDAGRRRLRSARRRRPAAGHWHVRDIDLRAHPASLLATRLSGRRRRRREAPRRSIRGELADAQSGLALDFAATIAGRRVDGRALSRAAPARASSPVAAAWRSTATRAFDARRASARIRSVALRRVSRRQRSTASVSARGRAGAGMARADDNASRRRRTGAPGSRRGTARGKSRATDDPRRRDRVDRRAARRST